MLAVLLISYFIFTPKNNLGTAQTSQVTKENLVQTVLSTGQVVSGTNLELGFQSPGRVSWVAVKEGDKVFKGQALATLDQSSVRASLTTAEGSLAQAQANFDKLMEGSTPEDINVYQDSVNSAQNDLSSAYSSALNTLNDAYNKIYNSHSAVATIQTSYFLSVDQPGINVQNSRDDINASMQNVKTYLDTAQVKRSSADIDTAISQMLLALSSVYGDLRTVRDQTDQGSYYARVPAADKTTLDTHKGYINTALTSVTTSQQDIASYRIALQKAQHQLDVQKAPPTQAEIGAAKAQILSAQGQVDSAKAALNNLVITAPLSGTVTEVDVKVGEQATALAKAIVLQNVADLHTEADVSEANIASLQIGQPIDYTFDALGPDKHYQGTVLTINPASTVISGVVNYKVKGSLENVPEIKPGMTANMTILVAKKDGALAVPSTAIINKNNKQYVRVVDDPKKLTFHEVEVQTGLLADGGLIEIISGLSEGQKIISYIKP